MKFFDRAIISYDFFSINFFRRKIFAEKAIIVKKNNIIKHKNVNILSLKKSEKIHVQHMVVISM